MAVIMEDRMPAHASHELVLLAEFHLLGTELAGGHLLRQCDLEGPSAIDGRGSEFTFAPVPGRLCSLSVLPSQHLSISPYWLEAQIELFDTFRKQLQLSDQ